MAILSAKARGGFRLRDDWAVILGLLALLYVSGCFLGNALRQTEPPFPFSHRLHVEEEGLECGDCHGRH